MITHTMVPRLRLLYRSLGAWIGLSAALCGGMAHAQNAAVGVSIDAQANRRAINPNIYGIAYGTPAVLSDLNTPLNRQGGNNTTRYNWQINADNRANDYYYESIGDDSAVPGYRGDAFISDAKSSGAQSMLTLPIIDWVAKLGANRNKLASFSVAKYGAQTSTDYWMPDAGNGIKTNGSYVTGNDPNDANVPSSVAFQQGWVQHLVSKWGPASSGGLRYYLLDNESSIWFGTHRDVAPTGVMMEPMKTKMINFAAMVKSVDPSALVVGPEEWGWDGFRYSGYDQQYGASHGYTYPDRAAHNNMDYVAYLLDQFHKYDVANGKRLLDVFSLHFYPQSGEFGNDTSTNMQLLRNRSTRTLWDPNYVNESWIGTQVQLIPRMKAWVNTYYPNTPIALTEYNWGAESHINGATTQADIFGILGREGMDMATRWTYPDPSTPTYKAMKIYRNYDGNKSAFGDTSVSTTTANPDNLSAFAATRASDGALTIMVINKVMSGTTPVNISLANFSASGTAQAWQLTSTNAITQLASIPTSAAFTVTVPAQSITLLVIPAATAAPNTGYRITCGSSAAVGTFSADNYYTGGTGDTFPQSIDTTGVANAAPAAVYQSLRWGNFSYSLPNLTAGATYTVRLHFAEDHYTQAGQRVFNVASNGTTVLTNLDIVAAVGANKALVKEFSTTADSNGKIALNFVSVTDYPQVNGIEVFTNSGNSPTIPSAPTGLTATVGNAQATLAWTAVTGATSYKVYRSTTNGSGYALVGTSAAVSIVDTGLTNGTTYYYVVTAVNSAGESANSNQASATPTAPVTIPSAPTGLTATAGNAQVTLAWIASAGATSYKVYRSTTSGSGYALVSTSATTGFVNTGLTNGTTYYYVVTALNTAGESANSNQASATPTAPSNSPTLTAVYQIDAGGGAVGTFSADRYYSGGDYGSFSQTIDTTGVANAAPAAVYQSVRFGNFNYTLPSLTAGATYTVRLHFAESYFSRSGQRVFNVAINGATVLSNFDILATVGVNKAVVRDFTATADSNGKIVITFTSLVDNALVNGVEILTGSTGSGPTLPSAPTGLTATVGNAQVTLAWTAVTGATSYKVYRSATNGSGYALVGASAAVSIVDTGLTNGTTYYYVVTAVNSAGESAYSNQASATPAAPSSSSAVYQIDAGGGAVGTFSADRYYSAGDYGSFSQTIDTTGVANAAPAAVYQSVRFGNFNYTLPSLTAGATYTVRLHFAESYFSRSGQRVFNVAINGATVLSNFDILATVGVNKAVVRDFTATADSNGKIVVTFTSLVDNALVNGVEILH